MFAQVKPFAVIILLLVSVSCFSQDKKVLAKKERPLEFHSCIPFFSEPDSCSREIHLLYGFMLKDFGCVTNKRIQRKFDRNNRKAKRAMDRRHGVKWEERLHEEIERCRGKGG